MNSFLYFAYGSNMLTERLQARCPSAAPIGIAYAPDHALNFTKTGKDFSGKATLFPQSGAHQYGVLFKINRDELSALDMAEGAGYRRDDDFCVIRHEDDAKIPVTTYLGTDLAQGLTPFDWYLNLIIAGARQHKLSDEQISSLQRTPYIVDTKANRKGRCDALAALKKAGPTASRFI